MSYKKILSIGTLLSLLLMLLFTPFLIEDAKAIASSISATPSPQWDKLSVITSKNASHLSQIAVIGNERKAPTPAYSVVDNGIIFSTDRRMVATYFAWSTMTQVWDTQTGKLVANLDGEKSGIRSVAFNNEGTLAAVVNFDGHLRLWHLQTRKYRTLSETVTSNAVFTPNGKTIVVGSKNEAILFWNVETGDEETFFKSDRPYEIRDIVFNQDSTKLLAISESSGFVSEINPQSKSTLIILNVAKHETELYLPGAKETLNWWGRFAGKDRIFIASVSKDKTISYPPLQGVVLELWDSKSSKSQYTLKGHRHTITEVKFSRTGDLVASADEGRNIRLWETQSGKLLSNIDAFSVHDFNLDGSVVAAGCEIWSSESGKSLNPTIEQEMCSERKGVLNEAFSLDGKLLAILLDDSTLHLWGINSSE